MDFQTSLEKQLNIYNDLLLDILSWQTTIIELKAGELAEKNNITVQEAMDALVENKTIHREKIMEEIYLKYSNLPDSINDILKPGEDNS